MMVNLTPEKASWGGLEEIGKITCYDYNRGEYDGNCTLFVKNTYGIFTFLVKLNGDALYIVYPEIHTLSDGKFNAYFRMGSKNKRLLAIPETLMALLENKD